MLCSSVLHIPYASVPMEVGTDKVSRIARDVVFGSLSHLSPATYRVSQLGGTIQSITLIDDTRSDISWSTVAYEGGN